jgi:hypothetical protein
MAPRRSTRRGGRSSVERVRSHCYPHRARRLPA